MNRGMFSKGVLLIVLVCMFVRVGLWGCKGYAKHKEIQQFRTLVEEFTESEINREGNDTLGDYMDSTETEVDWVEEERFRISFQKVSKTLPAEEWVKALENDKVKDKAFFIMRMEESNSHISQDAEEFKPLFDGEELNGEEKLLLYSILKPRGELKKRLEEEKWQWLPEAEDAGVVCDYLQYMYGYQGTYQSYSIRCGKITNRLLELCGYPTQKRVLDAANKLLQHPEKYTDIQLAGAALAKLDAGMKDYFAEYTKKEQEQMAKLLREEYERLAEEKKNSYGVGYEILEALANLGRKEEIDWMLEQVEKNEENLSMESWERAQLWDNILWKCVWNEDMQAVLKDSTDLEDARRMIRLLNQLLTMDYQKRATDFSSIRRMALYLQRRLEKGELQGELPFIGQVPMSDSAQIREENVWQVSCDVDGDGLADEETFHAMDEQYNAVYHIAFGNGDVLDYSYPVQFSGSYNRKWADVNGDGTKEVVVYFHMDQEVQTDVNENDVPMGNVETYGTLWKREIAGIVVFEKKEGSKEYTPVSTKSGGTMVTDIFDTDGNLDSGKSWLEELEEF